MAPMSAEKLREEIHVLASQYDDGSVPARHNEANNERVVDFILAAIRREVEKVPIVERVGNIHGTTPDERINRADVLKRLGGE
jgi:hypothetical protein